MQNLLQIQFVRFDNSKIFYKTQTTLHNNIVIEKIVALLCRDIVKFL